MSYTVASAVVTVRIAPELFAALKDKVRRNGRAKRGRPRGRHSELDAAIVRAQAKPRVSAAPVSGAGAATG